jgi:ABC-2 type transport system ATP-binding protein
MSAEVVLETQGISKRFGGLQAVQELSIQIRQGDIYGFLGPNGAGKTTSIRMILGLISPSRGTVRIFGHDIRKEFREAIRHVGAMVEGPAFYPYLTGRQNLKIYGRLSGGVSDARIQEVLEMVGMGRWGEAKVKGYSQGMRQRLGIAQALLHRPRLLILDEPTNGLDPQGMREVRGLVRRVSHDDGTTIFLSSHLLGEMEMVCNRIGVMHKGVVLVQGTMDELIGHAADMATIQVDQTAEARRFLKDKFEIEAQVIKQGWLEFPLQDRDLFPVNSQLLAAGFTVHAIAPRRRTLEEYFVKMTGDSKDVR